MPVFQLWEEIIFPPVELSEPDGLLAVGGDLSPERVIEAYRSGIFPWFDRKPILWWSPDPRFVLYPSDLRVSKSMKQVLDRNLFTITYNQNFKEVITHCAKTKRKGQSGTWITSKMIATYCELHDRGYAFSVESWKEGALVGGLYGVKMGRVFSGESMFSLVPNASKAAFIQYVSQLKQEGIAIIDCQVHSPHLESLGAKSILRKDFLAFLK